MPEPPLHLFAREQRGAEFFRDRRRAFGQARQGRIDHLGLFGTADHPLGQFVEVGRCFRVEGIDRHRADGFADRLDPLRRNAGPPLDDAEDGADRRAGAVGVVAAVDREAEAAAEIPFAVEQPDDREGDVGGRLEPAEIGAVFDDRVAGGFEIVSGLIFADCDADAAGDAAVGRNFRQRDVDQFADVAFDEGGGFQRGGEELRVDAVIGVVDAGVAPCELQRVIGGAGEEAGPDFGADPGAVAVLPLFVVEGARERRHQSVGHVHLADAVFVPGAGDVAEPVFAEDPFIHLIDAVLFDREQPDELKIEVVVGGGFSFEVLHVEFDVEDFATSLHGSAECAADVFSGPAAEHLVPVFAAVDELARRNLFAEHLISLLLFSASNPPVPAV